MIIGILQPSYLPWLGYFEQIYKSDIFVLYDDVQYEKGSWRNRNRIKTPHGIKWLTVPVFKKNKGHQLIKDLHISTPSPWQNKHIKAICQSYSKAPYFQNYSDDLFSIINTNWTFLCDLNRELLEWLCDILNIKTQLVTSSDLDIPGKGTTRLINIIKKLNGKTFFEGAAGKNYIDATAFQKAGITIQFQEYQHPIYRQLHGNFIPYLSVIDLLFNYGPKSLSIILRRKK